MSEESMSQAIDWRDLQGHDQLLRFVFDPGYVRGVLVSVDEHWRASQANQNYPPALQQLLGEAVAAGLALVATIKFEGRLTLQLQGNGPVSLLVVQIRSDLSFRMTANWSEAVEQMPLGNPVSDLVGDGYLVMTIEPEHGQRYQSMVSLHGQRFGHALEEYFRQSEQLPTRMVVAGDAERAVALLIQQMPGEGGNAERAAETAAAEAFEHLEALTGTLDSPAGEAEMLAVPTPVLMRRLFHEEQLRLLEMSALEFSCGCSRGAVAKMLRPLGREELLAAQRDSEVKDKVLVRCEFCGTSYEFDSVDIEQLLTDDSIEPPGETHH
jgi:molecular chaperone Hsp33